MTECPDAILKLFQLSVTLGVCCLIVRPVDPFALKLARPEPGWTNRLAGTGSGAALSAGLTSVGREVAIKNTAAFKGGNIDR